jgi:hypothetical protein
MLQAYVPNVSSISDVCCSKFFMLQMFHEQAQKADEGGGGPHLCAGSEVGTGSPYGAMQVHSSKRGRRAGGQAGERAGTTTGRRASSAVRASA